MTTNNKKIDLIAKKIGMTQIFEANNKLIPVTVLKIQETKVIQIKTIKSDGYNAIQSGYGTEKKHRVTKALQGHFKKAHITSLFKKTYEFKTDLIDQFKLAEKLDVSYFRVGEKIDVTGTSKGKGFQGVVKRYGFAGGPASHGSMAHRRGGSYGNCQFPGHVIKGKKMPGHMGSVVRTVQNLKIIKIIENQGLIIVQGSIVGSNGSTVKISSSKKLKKSVHNIIN